MPTDPAPSPEPDAPLAVTTTVYEALQWMGDRSTSMAGGSLSFVPLDPSQEQHGGPIRIPAELGRLHEGARIRVTVEVLERGVPALNPWPEGPGYSLRPDAPQPALAHEVYAMKVERLAAFLGSHGAWELPEGDAPYRWCIPTPAGSLQVGLRLSEGNRVLGRFVDPACAAELFRRVNEGHLAVHRLDGGSWDHVAVYDDGLVPLSPEAAAKRAVESFRCSLRALLASKWGSDV